MCSVSAVGLDENDEACDKNELKTLMTTDPVHLTSVGYEKLATGLLKKLDSGMTRAGKRKPEEVLESVRKRADLSKKRASWVSADDVTAIRSDPGGSRGSRGRGERGRGPRGGGISWRGDNRRGGGWGGRGSGFGGRGRRPYYY
jgi:hypothetical protein